jgi:hypothetical protein
LPLELGSRRKGSPRRSPERFVDATTDEIASELREALKSQG